MPVSDTDRRYASFLGSQLENDQAIALVAELRGKVTGYAYATIEGPDYMMLRGPAAVLNDVVVDPGHRGHGIGQRLLDAMLGTLKERGAPRVVLSTAEGNDTAQRKFARAGFRRTLMEMMRDLAVGGT